MEFPRYQPLPNAEFVGHLRPERGSHGASVAVPEAVVASERKVIAVSQGTVDNTDPSKLIIPTLEGLRGTPHLVVATIGGVNTDELRDRFAGPDAIIEDYLDFDALFPHIDAFVCNGGWGSALSAPHAGVPVIGAGTREGKNDNNARIGNRGLGVDLRTETPKPGQIADAFARVIDDPSITTNVKRVRDELDSYDTLAIVEDSITSAITSH